MKKTIYLVRHCKATGQEPGALLTAEGEKQAWQLAGFFRDKDIVHVISSPFTRAIKSIEPTADQLNLGIEIEDRLAERVLSTEDLPDWMERLKESFQDLDVKFSGGESGFEAIQRGLAAVAAAPDRSVLVTHGNLLSLLLRRIDNSYGYEEWKNLSNPDIYKVEVEEGNFRAARVWE